MRIFMLSVFLAVHVGPSLQAPESGDVLKISLYYEAFCPDCCQFITEQLYPAYQKIGSNLLIDFVPCGNTERKKENGKWVYACQHGPVECFINKIEACGLAKNSNQDKQVEFVNCVENLAALSADLKKIAECATHLGLTRNEILECAQGSEGNDLYGKLYDKQQREVPGLNEVPRINLNGQYDEAFENAAQEDFLSAACKKFSKKPSGCP